MRRARLLLLAATAGLAACASLPSARVPLTGEWGGTHVGLKLGESSGVLEYDCAAGTIDGPVIPKRDGRFTAVGTHTPGWGGPEIEGQVRPKHSVHYSGRVRGDRMTFQGRVATGVTLGPFQLRRGAEPILFRCL